MKTLIYKTGRTRKYTIEVSDEFYAEFNKMENESYNAFHRATRRPKVSLDELAENGIEFASDFDTFEEVCKQEQNEQLHKAISKLTKEQQDLIRKIFFDGLSQTEIAKLLGVDKSAIAHRLTQIYARLKEILS